MLAQLLTGVFLLLVSSPQVGRLWTFNELTSASDLVLVAKVVETQDTGRTTIHPGLRPDLPVVEMETELRVLTILKGGGPQAGVEMSIVLHHFRHERDVVVVNAGEELALKNGETYLSFLKWGELGWEPTTGHVFPNQSVFALGGAGRIGS